jgi:uncharacterized protein
MEESKYLGTDSEPATPPTSDERTLAILAHVLTFVAPIIAPLIIYLVKKDESTFIEAHARESLNFQITLIIAIVILVLTVIGILLIWLVGIVALVLVIVATIKASEGKLYKYPFTIRLIK